MKILDLDLDRTLEITRDFGQQQFRPMVEAF